ncbi:hypothetical protein BDA99DRAFT_498932 [Phascolomyces articulosus]|uniref:BZIP domain-containing protein n=1 Tax=Phascolomyces articulosus TaxID=60185 RepID=A0AAD5KJ37_9FUNG|nr:hypothetical protein BDA99DRAFT_498932 [Phascolomyces articulosus]
MEIVSMVRVSFLVFDNSNKKRYLYLNSLFVQLIGKLSENSHVLTAEQKLRRKEQNRAAQRAFRERKERYVKELETKIKFIEDTHATSMQTVKRENEDLRHVIKRMESELLAIKGAAAAYNEQLNQLRNEKGVDVPYFILPDVMMEEEQEQMELSVLQQQENMEKEDDDKMTDHEGSTDTSADSSMEEMMSTTSMNTAPPAAKRIMRVAPSAVACIRDKDGVSFCERLKEEVCSSAYDQLLSEPLFDPSSGVLNDAVTQHPVPIAAGIEEGQRGGDPVRHDFDRFMDSMTGRVILDPATHETKLVPCNEVWERLSEHPQFEQFDLDLLCEELKKKAKCSHDGTVLEEEELSEVLRKMEASVGHGGPER